MKALANQTVVVRHAGMLRTVTEGEQFDRNDPLVQQFGWLFEDKVEEATAAPGERRGQKR